MMKRISILILFLLMCMQWGNAQYHFSGVITDEKSQKIDGAQVMLMQNDSLIAMTLTDNKGFYLLENIKSGEYKVLITFLGYSPVDEKIFFRGRDMKVNFQMLPEMTGKIKEVEIVANLNDKVNRTATGQIFYLSEAAKNSGNPYRALREVPKLITDEVNQRITTVDGTTPLILIDGNRVNSGINPIDPKEIESVEVVDVVNARYLKDGVRKIVNIKLKKKASAYKYFETMQRVDLKRKGMAALYYEIGNPNVSLYGRTAGSLLYNDDSRTNSMQQNSGYMKQLDGTSRQNSNNILSELQLRWMATDKDYFVAHIYGRKEYDKVGTKGDGTMMQNSLSQQLNYNSLARSRSYVLTGTLFHKHSFTPSSSFETTFAYNRNHNNDNSHREEYYPDWSYQNLYRYSNNRSSYNLTFDYSLTWNKVNSLNIGSEGYFINDRIHEVSSNYPPFLHKEWNEYLYAGFSSSLKKLYYMASVGMEGIWLKADDATNHYFKPRTSVSLTYSMNDNNSLQLSYTLTNTAPSVHNLNPYNVSTDSLIISRGNPYLKPMQNHEMDLSYTFNTKGLYLTPAASYQISKDLIEDYGYTDKGIFINTFRNSGTFRRYTVGGNINYRFKWGDINFGADHAGSKYDGKNYKNSITLSASLTARYKKWTYYMYSYYTNYDYSAMSYTRNYTPSYSLIQLTYNFTKLFYISAALENWMGEMHPTTVVRNGSYYSYSQTKLRDQSFSPWILLRYTFRQNSSRRVKETKLMNSKEKGIKL